jgi:predicted ATP-grasp superfamily ATP-dependent carboligase
VRVLVTDGASRVALAVVRALGRAGARVSVVEQDRFAARTPAAFRSRFVRRADVLPALGPDGAFLEALVDRSREADVLLPVSTNVLLACAEAGGRFACPLAAPEAGAARRANDKSRSLAAARRAGVPVPRSWSPEALEDLDGLLEILRFPAVVKLRDDEGTVLDPGERYRIVRTGGELRRAWAELHRLKPFPLVQERIRGPGFGVGVLAEKGRVVAALAHRRLRELPVAGGPSAAAVTVEDARLRRYAEAVIRELGWTGVAMVEFKRDDDYRFLEVNPRFWGALPLALAAGVNFPDLLCRQTLGEAVSAAPGRAGVKLRFLGLEAAAFGQALAARRWDLAGAFLADLADPAFRDGIFEWDDLEASLAYYAARLPS